MKSIKQKIESDAIKLGVSDASIERTTSSKDAYSNKVEQSRTENSPLPSFIANNIRTTHFQIGPGGKVRPSET